MPSEGSDHHPLRWRRGRGSKPCVGCGGHFAPGHAYQNTEEGQRHVDCRDKWLGYFDE
jgi:hypothetical protein